MAEKAVSLRPQLKILYMSGYANTAIVINGTLKSDIHFIEKPFTPQSFLQKVRETLDR